MFMFVFFVTFVAIVGLFFQVIQALTLAFALQQTGMGQQMLFWHNMVLAYACRTAMATAPLPLNMSSIDPNGGGMLRDAVKNFRAATAGVTYNQLVDWNSSIFLAQYNGANNVRMVVTYTDPAQSYGGLSSGEVGRQLTTLYQNEFTFGQVIGQQLTKWVRNSTDGSLQSFIIDFSTVPVGFAPVNNGNAIVSPASCS
jgi:hypothetical protein